jgi:type II secretion system protein G
MQKINHNTAHKNGFSLIELIVVIAIIGLLASVVLASLGQSRQKADIAKAKSDFRALSHALELYRQSQGGLPPSPDGLAITDLVNNYLSEYLKTVPQISPVLITSADAYYYTNPVTDGTYYNCGNADGAQEYFVTFVASQQAIDSGEFSQIYTRGGDASAFPTERCFAIDSD